MPIRVLLVDDHTLVRAGIHALLARIPDVEVVAEASTGLEALALVEKHHPDVLIVDIAMVGLNGLETSARVTRLFPEVKVMILSMHSNEEYVMRALTAGAVAYLLKDAAATELEFALRAVASGGTYLSSNVSRKVVDAYLTRVGGGPVPPGVLTPRQQEVLRMVAEGMSTKEIAFELDLSPKTVETHRADLMARLDIHDVAGLVKYAMRHGLIRSEQ
jgi:DNA-binding NarL/FixJ family response regulator